MNLNDYQKQAITTKIYDDSVAIPYVILGIAGEAAELYEKIRDYQQGGDVSFDLIGKECADIVWYLAAYADETGQKLNDLIIENTDYEYPLINPELDLQNLVIYSGRISEYGKKALRDDFEYIKEGLLPQDKIEKINKAVAGLFKATSYIAEGFGLDLGQILRQNIEKLASRAERGVLGGSGDNR